MTSLSEKKREHRDRRLFNLNRILIVVMVAAILVGLTFDQWDTVLRNAVLL